MSCITYEDGAFLLTTAHSAYLLLANEHGHIEQLHYGAPVSLADAAALRYKHTMPYGSEVLYTPDDPTYCLDNLPLNWSGIGKGDFRVPPFEAVMPDGSFVSDFVYDSFELRAGDCPADTLPTAYGEAGEAETLILRLREKAFPQLMLELIYTVFPGEDVIARRAVLRNGGDAPVTLRRMMSMLLDLPNRDYRLVTLDGDWIAEANRHERPLMPGCFVNESSTGASSNRHNPGVLLASPKADEAQGEVYGFNLVYSGNHYTAAELSSRGFVRVVSGINPLCFSWTLAAGERFETPQAVMSYSAAGFGGVSRAFHDFVNRRIVRGDWKDRERPVLFNSWESCFFKFTRCGLLRLARRAKALGAELFVLDDGWFKGRNDDAAGLGDYEPDRRKLPGGVAGLARDIVRMGLRFGIWVEPECVNEESDLFRAHPDWAVRLPGRAPSYGRNQLVLDLTRPEVRDYIVAQVGALLDGADISYVKWDMNRHMSDLFSKSCPAGEFFHRYVLGLYEVLGRIFRPRPQLLLESCSSGGNRFDLGMLCFSPQIWASDDTDPIERLRIQRGLSLFYPLSAMGAHVSQAPHQQTLRATPLPTRFAVAAFGALGYELDPADLTPVERAEVKRQIAFYKAHRRLFQYGVFSRGGADADRRQTLCCAAPDGSEAVAAMVQTLMQAGEPGDRLAVPGLRENARYTLETVPQKVAVGRFGGLIKHIFPLKLRADGFLLRTANRLFALPDGALKLEASGSALGAGVALGSQFIGTGYHKDLRLWGDFGSQMYTATLKQEKDGNENNA